MKMINRLIAIALCVALIITTLPADASALRSTAYKNYCTQPEKKTLQLQPISPIKQKANKPDSAMLRRMRKVYGPLLYPLLLLPIALLFNHKICEYIIRQDREYGRTTFLLHFLSNSESKIKLFTGIASFFGHLYLLWLYYPTKKIMTKRLILVATVCLIYGISLRTFDIAKYDGVIDYILIGYRLYFPGDLLFSIAIFCMAIALIGIIRDYINDMYYYKKITNSVPDTEKAISGSHKDFIGEDLMADTQDGNDRTVSITTPAQEVSLPKIDSLSHGLHTKVFLFDSAA